ncbi:hypothetical protein [uncultured Fusobacterium sp.]|uniref:hypothetical protein n=1 Tax=uncultured Fusobacterium sp. TaxID=159267 RepID=UPI0025F92289|nr:hypothetical protein [uncultured Fusobacterium sp.]
MEKYIIEGKEVTKLERLDSLKKLTSDVREQIIKQDKNLSFDEIDLFLELLEKELKFIFS